MAEKNDFKNNYVMVYMRPNIKEIVESVAQSDPVLSSREKPNLSGAITKIILEWEQSRRISNVLPR